jgi:hypothetical protein
LLSVEVRFSYGAFGQQIGLLRFRQLLRSYCSGSRDLGFLAMISNSHPLHLPSVR